VIIAGAGPVGVFLHQHQEACDAKDRLGVNAVLVRPDGVVAWVSEVVAHLEDVVRVASRWFGESESGKGTRHQDV
jgi:hypothetical protein